MTARTRLLPILVLLAFAAALYALHRLLAGHTWTEIAAEFSALPPERLAAAVGAMLVGYAALFVLEHRTLATVGTPVTLRRAALAAFLYHAINNAVGMAGTAGNVTFQWAQATSDAGTTTVYANSWISYRKIP